LKQEDVLRRNAEKQRKIDQLRQQRADAEEQAGTEAARLAAERRQRLSEHQPLPPYDTASSRVRRPSMDSNAGGSGDYTQFATSSTSSRRRPSQDLGHDINGHHRTNSRPRSRQPSLDIGNGNTSSSGMLTAPYSHARRGSVDSQLSQHSNNSTGSK
jgi:hypothetical protein